MKTKYFDEYIERTNNNLPAVELTGKVWIHCINGNYLAILKSDDGKIYDLPHFMIKYTNRKVAVIARIYSKNHIVKTSDKKDIKVYNKLVIVRARPIDLLESELEEFDGLEE